MPSEASTQSSALDATVVAVGGDEDRRLAKLRAAADYYERELAAAEEGLARLKDKRAKIAAMAEGVSGSEAKAKGAVAALKADLAAARKARGG